MMRLSSLIPFALAAIGLAHAQVTHNVIVGSPDGALTFNPNQLNANVGDVVIFEFHQKNHTVTQSSFDDPCTPLQKGFDSGFEFVAPNNTQGPFPTVQLKITSTDPVWAHCRQTGHCSKGMVIGINPGSKFAAFQAAALATANSSSSSSGAPASGSGSGSGSSSGSGSTTPTNHMVTVGPNGTLTYSPSNITAAIGDTVTFQFMAKNHTATQSTFNTPCTKKSITSGPGFDSGFMPVSPNATEFPTFTVTVNDTNPTWVYCGQTNPKSHCGAGMVFAINANESSPNTFEAFQALAEQQNGTNSSSSGGGSGGSSGGNSTGNSNQNAASSAYAIPGVLINVFVVLLGLTLVPRQ